MDFSSVSKELTTRLPKDVKKNSGIYFTPPSCVKTNLQLLEPYLQCNKINVLEPSCGSGEYITALHSKYPQFQINAIEYNETIYNAIQPLQSTNVRIHCSSYLEYLPTTQYNLIIGNPPYFVMKKGDVDKSYYPYFDGRPNIFVLFIVKSLTHLAENGILSFVLPTSFLNCLYYNNVRNHIATHYQILCIHYCHNDKYLETQQDTVIFILRKQSEIDNSKFVWKNKYTIFSTHDKIEKMTQLCYNSKSLVELGYKVSVGNVVWNQHKPILTDDNTKTLLIYSSNIENKTLVMKKYSNTEKKNYIDKQGTTRPMIVINRGYGVGEYKFNYCLIDIPTPYLVENHLICIECIGDKPRETMIEEYKKILASLEDTRTTEFIDLYFENSAINTTEMNNVLPIY
jgi:tRNA1(Val) A37 N6-methylase TrmN6